MTLTKVKIIQTDHYSELKILITHPMENGRSRDAHNQLIPAHFIQNLQVFRNQIEIIHLQLGGSISKQPFLVFHLEKLQPGEQISVHWLDNQGQTDSVEQTIQ